MQDGGSSPVSGNSLLNRRRAVSSARDDRGGAWLLRLGAIGILVIVLAFVIDGIFILDTRLDALEAQAQRAQEKAPR